MKLKIVSLLLLRTLLCSLTFVACALAIAAHIAPLQHFTIVVDGHPLAVWARIAPHPQHALLLLHGRTWSSLPNFDLQVTADNSARNGKEDTHSIMMRFAANGYAVYALDLRGYGATPRNADGWTLPLQAANDVAYTLQWIAQKHPTLAKPALLGWSNGSLVAHLTAQLHCEFLSDLILYGYPRDVGAAVITATTSAKSSLAPTPKEPLREVNTIERAKSDFISPQVISAHVVDAYVAAALKADPIRADWSQLEEFRQLEPKLVNNPTLVIQGARDPLAPIAAQSRLFVALNNPDKQWVVLAGADHAALLEDSQPAFVAAIRAFIERPKY